MHNIYEPEGTLLMTAQNIEYTATADGLRRAMAADRILEAPAVLCDGDMNLSVDLGGVRGVIPHREVALTAPGEEVRSIAVITRVGKPVCFKVLSVEEKDGQTVATLSRRAAQAECRRNFIADLCPGDILPARITHMEPFGAFVDIGCGIPSLLTIDCISVSRISHPSDRFSVGESIPVVIRSVDPVTDRIFVTHRELLGSWEENAAAFSPMQTVTGIVRSIESYGVFVELAPNLAGLAECKPGVRVGDIAGVYIKSILPERMKIKLVLIDTYPGYLPQRKKYYIDTETVTHIDRWRYSPECCPRCIETVF